MYSKISFYPSFNFHFVILSFPQYLGDIEEHLGVVIDEAKSDMKVTANEFDGKVVYGQKRKHTGESIETRSLYILTGEAAHLAKMKPPIYGHFIYITKSVFWKAPNGGVISRNCCITHSRRTTLHNKKCLLKGGRYVKKKASLSPIGRLRVVEQT